MYMLNIRFRIPLLASKLFLMGKDGKVSTSKVDAYYDRKLLEDLRDYPGLKWKIWAVSSDGRHGEGFYLFNDRESAELRAAYAKKYYPIKGMMFTRCYITEVAEGCSRFTRAPIDVPANPRVTEEQAKAIMESRPAIDIKDYVEKYKRIKRVV